jgi:hypothetical protein
VRSLTLAQAVYPEDKTEIWRRLTAEICEEKERQLNEAVREATGWGRYEGGTRRIGGGAPSIVQCLARLDQAAPINNTFTAAQSIIGTTGAAGPVGPFSVDYFKTIGASWTQEAHGIISTTGTPTIAYGTYYGVVVGTITTNLCITATLTTASALANVNWYWKTMARTIAVSETTSTTISLGMLWGNIEVLGATAATEPWQGAVNATPPTAVTTDMSTAICIDLKATWGTSSASNTITTNWYALMSLYA